MTRQEAVKANQQIPTIQLGEAFTEEHPRLTPSNAIVSSAPKPNFLDVVGAGGSGGVDSGIASSIPSIFAHLRNRIRLSSAKADGQFQMDPLSNARTHSDAVVMQIAST